jgi:outer membrane receptor protein involved in Fe transport
MPQKFRVFLIAIIFAALLHGQGFLAAISGRVTDPSGAAVADAEVQVQAVGTGQISVAKTDANGLYQILSLSPGQYNVTVERSGFQRSVNQNLQLEVAQKTELNIALSVGDLQQTVQVTAEAAVVQADSADHGLTIDKARVENAPLQGRNIFAAAWSAPGVAVTSKAQRLRPFDISGSSNMSINGGQPSTNEVLIDGVSNLSAQGTSVAYVPPVDSTDEFRVQTTNFDAQYGWTTGGVVNIITKGGTNDYHGVLYEYLQNTLLNANTFGSNRNGVSRQSSHINTFGGDIGGPIKKNKLFFFFSYEDLRQVIPDPFVTSVPSALQRQGDFSQSFYKSNGLQKIYNPFSTVTAPDGSVSRAIFPNNVIPTSMLNPIALKVLSIIPLGNVAGNPVTGLNNLANTGQSRKFTDFFPEYLGRVDYQLSDNTKMFVRYSQNNLTEARGFHYSTVSQANVAETSGNAPFERNNNSATIQLTHVFSPTTILELRAGLLRFTSVGGGNNYGAGYDLASLGFSPQFVSQAAPNFPKFNWANYEGAGNQPSQLSPIAQTNSFQGTVSKTLGRQTLKMGGEFRLQRVNQVNPGYVAGNFTFDQQFTGQNPLKIQPDSGNAIASFLLGVPASGYINVNNNPARQQRMVSLFTQDDIRFNERLTINLGLRWDHLSPITDRFDALTRGFDMTTASPLQVPGLNLKGGLQYVGEDGLPRNAYNSQWNNFGPRVGFAYRLTNKTVLRAGYGLLYGQTFNDPGLAQGFSQQTAMVTSIQTGLPYNTLTNPFPAGILEPAGASLGLLTNLGQNLTFSDPTGGLPRVQQFSVELQRELPFKLLASAAYVGSRSRSLSVSQLVNEVSAQDLALGASALTRNIANPMAGLIPATSLNGASVQRYQLLRPFPQFLNLTEQNRPIGKSRYDALQLLLSKRMSANLSASVSYTYSKTFTWTNFENAQDTQLEKVVAPWDVTHSVQINALYQLPFGKGQRFGSGMPSALRYVASGWQVSALVRLQGGMPMPYPSGQQSGNPVAYPTGAAPTGVNPKLDNPTLDHWFNTCTLLANGSTSGCQSGEQPAWTVRQPYTEQRWSSYFSNLRLPAIYNLDMSIIKANKITERVNLIFRTDLINATNTPQFYSGLNMDVNSANFGHIAGVTDQSNLPRVIQFSLKLQF